MGGRYSSLYPAALSCQPRAGGSEFADGILTVTLHKAEEARPKSIKIKAKGELAGAGNSSRS